MTDNKIFIYLRLRDDKKILGKSRIREFTGITKLLGDFIQEIWEKFGLETLKMATLEYMDANSDMVLISFRQDIVKQQMIISGLIPKEYQTRMLNEEEVKLKVPLEEFFQKNISGMAPKYSAILKKRLETSMPNILSLIKKNINETGEFYIALNNNPYPLEF